MELESQVRCIYQAISSKDKIKLPTDFKPDYGCDIYTYDDKNKECPKYYPIKIYYFKIEK